MLCCAALRCAVLVRASLRCAELCYAALHWCVLLCVVLCCAVLCRAYCDVACHLTSTKCSVVGDVNGCDMLRWRVQDAEEEEDDEPPPHMMSMMLSPRMMSLADPFSGFPLPAVTSRRRTQGMHPCRLCWSSLQAALAVQSPAAPVGHFQHS